MALIKNTNARKYNILQIAYLLRSIKSVKKMLTDKNNNKNIEFLNALSHGIKLENCSKNKILMKFGDRGNKFYIILKGSVSIFIPISYDLQLSEDEYIKNLYLLRNYEEFGLIQKIIGANKHVYNFSEEDLNSLYKYLKEGENNKDAKLEKNESKESGGETKKRNSKFSLSNSSFLSKILLKRGSIMNLDVHLYENCTNDEYIERSQMNKNSDNSDYYTKTNKIQWFGYKLITNLTQGDKFGDLALINDNSKR